MTIPIKTNHYCHYSVPPSMPTRACRPPGSTTPFRTVPSGRGCRIGGADSLVNPRPETISAPALWLDAPRRIRSQSRILEALINPPLNTPLAYAARLHRATYMSDIVQQQRRRSQWDAFASRSEMSDPRTPRAHPYYPPGLPRKQSRSERSSPRSVTASFACDDRYGVVIVFRPSTFTFDTFDCCTVPYIGTVHTQYARHDNNRNGSIKRLHT